jgi:hypothetical protein
LTTDEFLTVKLAASRAELDTSILNRNRWDKVRDDCRMLVFLQGRAAAVDFQSVRQELQHIAEGSLKVPDITGPRRKAEDCLRLWANDLKTVD